MRVRDLLVVVALAACLGVWVLPWTSSVLPEHTTPPPTRAVIEVTVESRPVLLKDVKFEVKCSGPEEFEVGYDDGRPVAFFTLDWVDPTLAIAGFVSTAYAIQEVRRYSPAQTQKLDQLSFSLYRTDFAPHSGQDVLTASTQNDPVGVSVYVWLDGEWRVWHTVWQPVHNQPDAIRPVTPPLPPAVAEPIVLDLLYKRRLSQCGDPRTSP